MGLSEARERVIVLFDFYEALLTPRQREIFTMHYMDDCSLAETGESAGITPQAVADMLKRTTGRLKHYEKLLGLAEKHEKQVEMLEKIKELSGNNENSEEIKELIETLTV